ncbi:MAG: rod shape-determining protein RodA [Thermonema sp.]|uniref:rod shape-determining protein RodA n=1 Tax=Thermonema sp. TaxID=2231181 RepID=UPI0021DD9A64|nr:rod shape-determining protein RodA [Thermonema sp.]GIV38213.1 MAG: rod shape-determining protein RodA [Thermonema sp.]
MRNQTLRYIDWLTVFLYAALVLIGLLSIYSAVYAPQDPKPIYSLTHAAGKQLLWIGGTLLIITVIFFMDYRLFESLGYIAYGVGVLLLALVLVFGVKIGGARAWFDFGGIRLQPAEFAKVFTSLALAKYLSNKEVRLNRWRDLLIAFGIIGLPALLILLQPDAGSTLVFAAFVLVMFREGLSPLFLIIPALFGLTFVLALVIQPISYLLFAFLVLAALLIALLSYLNKGFSFKLLLVVGIPTLILMGFATSVDTIFQSDKILKPHQKERILVLIDENIDKEARRSRYNLQQSKIAIGSGGFAGKGYLQGTQTKFNFVPEQQTDFIFCTIGEEFGWLGSMTLITLFVALMSRIVYIAERQKLRFARIYGYCVASILFMHFTLNLAMTMGLFPVVGIPLPFISYGGSSLWAFSTLLFILLKLDAHRNQIFWT